MLVPYAVVLSPNCSQQEPAYQAVLEPPNELLTEVNWEDNANTERAKTTVPLRQEGTKEMAEGISQGIKAQRMRPHSIRRPDSQGGWQAFPQHRSTLPWSLGQGSWGSARTRLKGGTTLDEEGNVALDSYCRAFRKAQPDGRERRPGCSQKNWWSSAQAWQRTTRGTWLGRGPSLGLPLSWLPGTAKPVIQAQLGLLMSSVPPTTHWITDSGRIKTSVPSYDFHLWFRRHFKIPQSHGVTVSRSPILLVRPSEIGLRVWPVGLPASLWLSLVLVCHLPCS